MLSALTPSGLVAAWSASAWVMYPAVTMDCRTSERRLSASGLWRNGLYSEGAWGRPASSANWARLSFCTGLSKNTRDAAATP